MTQDWMNLYQIGLLTLVVIIKTKMKIMQLTIELPAMRALETKCTQESMMKPHHERVLYLLTLYKTYYLWL